MLKGDIVLINFPFTDLTGSKLRPAVILNAGEHDVTVNFISTKIQWFDKNDLILTPTTGNGLKKISVVRVGKITTLEKSLLIGKIGELDPSNVKELNRKLIAFFNLDLSDFNSPG